VIAIDVSREPTEQEHFDSSTAILSHAFVIMEHSMAHAETALADVVIHPDLAQVPATDLAARGEAIRAGEEAARAALPRIRELIAQRAAK
jgi:NTE family protein